MRWGRRKEQADDQPVTGTPDPAPLDDAAPQEVAQVTPEQEDGPRAPQASTEDAPEPVQTDPQTGDVKATQDAGREDTAPQDTSTGEQEPISAVPPGSGRHPGRGRPPRRLGRGGLWWVLPAAVLLLVVTGWPLGKAVFDSLFQSSLVTPADRSFAGLDVYASVLSSRTWWMAVATTIGFVVVAVVAQLVLASAFATALRRIVHGRGWLLGLLLVPFALLSVVTAVLWRDALTVGFGPEWFGYDGDSGIVGLTALLASEVWRGTGITTLILLAGLARVSPALREAAVADGANAWQRFWRVTRPAAAPAIAVAVVYRALEALRVLEAPLIAGDQTRETVSVLVWDSTFEAFELGLGAATSVLLLALAAIVGIALAKLLGVRRVL